ncbi:HepT-like ribonuclease domain-containing protein [Ottowia sp.]|uniref:HepT-like ribonuclease domain-containing protein n=1 Tax=Ottowia sp. TaxID=1898956 RepID=UPI0032C21318
MLQPTPQLPLAVAYQMRNAVAHGYFKVDLGIVWQTIQGDLGDFQVQIQQARDTLGLDSNPHRKP